MLKHMEEIFVMKFKNVISLIIVTFLCFFLSACTDSKSITPNPISKNSANTQNQTNESVPTYTETDTPKLTNNNAADVPIQQIYINEQEASNFQLHMSSIDDSLKNVGHENQNTSDDSN